jgi:cold-inducible RNA-binding protein
MKIFVGNLPWSVDEEAFNKLFADYETEEVILIKDKFSGKSKGFGFVTADDETGKKIIADLNEKEVEGRNMTVNEARPQEDRPKRNFDDGPRRSFGGNRDGGQRSFGGNNNRSGGSRRY